MTFLWQMYVIAHMYSVRWLRLELVKGGGYYLLSFYPDCIYSASESFLAEVFEYPPAVPLQPEGLQVW